MQARPDSEGWGGWLRASSVPLCDERDCRPHILSVLPAPLPAGMGKEAQGLLTLGLSRSAILLPKIISLLFMCMSSSKFEIFSFNQINSFSLGKKVLMVAS